MLLRLAVSNFAIIDRIEVEFGAGFNVITGETGAGKSIVINALNLLLGDRASGDLVRSGSTEAAVEALFEISEKREELLREKGIPNEDGQLIVRRVISESGRSRAYLNGSLQPIGLLREIGAELVDLFGQHDHQSLTRESYHLQALDEFANTTAARRELGRLVSLRKSLVEQIEELTGAKADDRIDYLSFQINEIDDAALRVGEEDELAGEKKVLVNAEKLSGLAGGAEEALYSADGSIIERLAEVSAAIEKISAFDKSFAERIESPTSISATLEDLAAELRDYAATVEADPNRLDEIEQRLEILFRLKKKHGADVEEILQKRIELGAELDRLLNSEAKAAELSGEIARIDKSIIKQSVELTEKRKAAAEELEKRIVEELADLAMPGAIFKIALEPNAGEGVEAVNSRGAESCEFLISTNPGQEPKPLIKIASGGELSRIMLALKTALFRGEEKGPPTLVFDEVDAGIGGATAVAVGRKLKNLSVGSQVLVITHLPQIAGLANEQFRVEKQATRDATTTSIARLSESERVDEIARMIGADEITATTIRQAEEMLERGEK